MNRVAQKILTLVLASVSVSAVIGDDNQMSEVRFTGSLVRPQGDQPLVIRNFEVLLLDGDRPFFCVLDDEREGCPWPESFGLFSPAGERQPRLIVSYDQLPYSIALPFLKLRLDDTTVGATQQVGDWALTVDGVSKSDDGVPLLEVSARERRGRRQSLTFDPVSGRLQSASLDVFMGQGEQFSLSVTQTAATLVTAASVSSTKETIDTLLALQEQLGRRPDSQLQELSSRQVAAGRKVIEQLTTQSADTALAEAVFRIRRNLTRQQRRVEETMSSRERIVGSAAPGFQLNLIDGSQLNSASLAGKTTILHFWKYSDKPLKEPYGQVGYLEFLYNKQSANGVRVLGIATNPSLQDSQQTRQAQRGARKLQEFMNLTYPIGWDDGSLIRSLGDPRESGGDLPLWVIVGADGKVAHYHAGFYEVDRRAGLRELTEALDGLK